MTSRIVASNPSTLSSRGRTAADLAVAQKASNVADCSAFSMAASSAYGDAEDAGRMHDAAWKSASGSAVMDCRGGARAGEAAVSMRPCGERLVGGRR